MDSFTISKQGSVYSLNGSQLSEQEMRVKLRPFLNIINKDIVLAHNAFRNNNLPFEIKDRHKKTPLQIANEIANTIGLRIKVVNDDLHVYCQDDKVWKKVDSISATDCTECQKARLIRTLANFSNMK